MVPAPVESEISKRVRRYTSQDVCPWNVKFATARPDDSAYRARAAVAGKDARQLALEILAMTDEEFRAAFEGSPTKPAKRPGSALGPAGYRP